MGESCCISVRTSKAKKPAVATLAAKNDDAAEVSDLVDAASDAWQNLQAKAQQLLVVHQKWVNEYGLVMQALAKAELKLSEALQKEALSGCSSSSSGSSAGSSIGGSSMAVGSSTPSAEGSSEEEGKGESALAKKSTALSSSVVVDSAVARGMPNNNNNAKK